VDEAEYRPDAVKSALCYIEAMRYTWMQSPVGDLLLAGAHGALHRLSFAKGSKAVEPDPSWQRDDGAFTRAIGQLREYFSGKRKEFELRLCPAGTEFQLQVWEQLRAIPYGQTISYGELARRLGNPAAARAVGLANGCNPIAIIIPCHRVIGASGKLTGFGGGLDVKEKLLALERGEQRLALE
jgi:methylated-DNA-[protein]-cysteine S-methyltransferase